jgi:hypothetical protein
LWIVNAWGATSICKINTHSTTAQLTLKDRQENDAQPNEHKEKHQ